MSTFTEAAKGYAEAVRSAIGAGESRNQGACRVVAIGFLSGDRKGDINTNVRTEAGFTEAEWNVAKVALSRAWRAIAGEFGFGEELARQWARGDFHISLNAAYDASAGPTKRPDRVARAVKLLMSLTVEEVAEVIERVDELRADVTDAENKRAERFRELMQVA